MVSAPELKGVCIDVRLWGEDFEGTSATCHSRALGRPAMYPAVYPTIYPMYPAMLCPFPTTYPAVYPAPRPYLFAFKGRTRLFNTTSPAY